MNGNHPRRLPDPVAVFVNHLAGLIAVAIARNFGNGTEQIPPVLLDRIRFSRKETSPFRMVETATLAVHPTFQILEKSFQSLEKSAMPFSMVGTCPVSDTKSENPDASKTPSLQINRWNEGT